MNKSLLHQNTMGTMRPFKAGYTLKELRIYQHLGALAQVTLTSGFRLMLVVITL